jgi:UDP-N-acetylmuramoylalanine--D-glutamate ligase
VHSAAELTPRPPLPEGPYLVVGLARSGQAVARMLAGRGERVAGCDAGHPEGAEGLVQVGVEVSLNVDGTALLDGIETVVKSPGVPGEAPVVQAARERGIEVSGELELAWRSVPNRFVAVTGTNGKTTTTELIGHLYRRAGRAVAVAGNVGTPLASLAGAVGPAATVVCECSSFQLEDSSAFAPECAVFLNLEPDHLDRHGTLERYLAAKLRIFANQGPGDVAVYNGDEPALAEAELGGKARRVRFCPRPRDRSPVVPPEGGGEGCAVSLEGDEIRWRRERLLSAGELKLIGAHNVENAMAAAAAALEDGIAAAAVAGGLRTFEAVPHRLERIAEIGGVLYVNDSKATNVASALAGIESFEGGVHLILGGSTKGETFERLAGPVGERCLACYLIGEAAERLAEDLSPAARDGVGLESCGTLERAVERAAARARPGEVVLLSPACASFDAFADFEQRGERFRELVEALR